MFGLKKNSLISAAAFLCALLPAAASAALQTGGAAPNVNLTTTTGATVSLESLRGRPVYLDFYATWCPYCKAETPTIESLQNTYGKNVAIVGVDEEESATIVRQFAAQNGLTYTMALDPNGSAGDMFGADALPTNVFIDRNGSIRSIHTGEMTASEIEGALKQIE